MTIRYGDDVREAVWALACQLTRNGAIPRQEIRDRLAAGDSPLGRPLELPKRTLDDMLTRLKADRGDPAASVSPSEAGNALDAIQLESIGALRKHVRDLRQEQRTRTLTAAEITSLAKAGMTAQELERRRTTKPDTKQRDRRNAAAASPSNLTRDLSKALETAH